MRPKRMDVLAFTANLSQGTPRIGIEVRDLDCRWSKRNLDGTTVFKTILDNVSCCFPGECDETLDALHGWSYVLSTFRFRFMSWQVIGYSGKPTKSLIAIDGQS
jgi:hypothetical protein